MRGNFGTSLNYYNHYVDVIEEKRYKLKIVGVKTFSVLGKSGESRAYNCGFFTGPNRFFSNSFVASSSMDFVMLASS